VSSSLLKQSLAAIETLQARLAAAERSQREPIAIVGAGCRYPGGADSPESLWRLARDGVNAIGPAPDGRGEFADPGRRGGFLADLDRFDPGFFGISPREANSVDPQQRLLLETSYEALERAGIAVDSLAGSRTGVFVGITVTDYAELQIAGRRNQDPYVANGGALSTAAGRLSFVYGLEGPSMAIDTACSSSLVAVHLAVQSLRSGETTLALAGGVNVILRPILTALLANMGLMAADAVCKPFDASADGFVRSEGCGMIVLKRLADARAAGDPILAVIRGSAVNSDGRSSGMTVPHGPAQERLIRAALANADLKPSDIDYVEAHGTGTSLGDPIEMEALAAALARNRPTERPLLVGALKSNIGHAESASGIAGLIKTVMAIRHGAVPPTLHLNNPSPKIAWSEIAVRVPTQLTPWPQSPAPRRAGVSGFGFSGTNAHVILEQAPAELDVASPAAGAPPVAGTPPVAGPHLIPLCADSEPALRALAARHAEFIATRPNVTLADYAVTMGRGRSPLPRRLGVIAGSLDELAESLRQHAAGQSVPGTAYGEVRTGQRPKIAFLFTGQGAQYHGMARGLYRTEPVFRAAVDRCDLLLTGRMEHRLTEVMGLTDLSGLTGAPVPECDRALLSQTRYTQPVLFVLQYALAELWRSWGVMPQLVLGHSVGEYAAACVAGVFSLEAGLDLIVERGSLMQALPPGGTMAAVFASETTVLPYLVDGVSIAALNGPQETVISGATSALAALCRSLQTAGIDSRLLDVSHAFHSALLDPMLDALEARCATMSMSEPRVPFISNLTGKPHAPGSAPDARYWRRQAREPVRFAEGVAALRAAGVTALLEIGPHPTLLKLAQRAAPDAAWRTIASLHRGRDDRREMLTGLQALYLSGLDPVWGADGGRRVELPTYSFQRTRHWMAPQDAQATEAPAARDAQRTQRTQRTSDRQMPRTIALRWQSTARAPRALPDRCVIVSDEIEQTREFAHRLVGVLRAQGSVVVPIEYPGDSGPSASDLRQALADQPGLVIDCRALGRATDPVEHDVPAAARALYDLSLNLLKAVAEAGSRVGACLLTQGGLAVAAGDALALPSMVLPGQWRAAAAEHPERTIVLGDLDPGGALEPDAVPTLLRSLGLDQPEAALRNACVLTPMLADVDTGAVGLAPLRSDATYLVSGGLGGVGLNITEWLVAGGAGAVVVLGRQPPGARQSATLDTLRAAGGRIESVQCDVGDPAALEALRERTLSRLPPLRGVVHAAGVLADAPLADQDAAHFDSVARSKLDGAWTLHAFTLSDPLELFVLCSSVSATFGAAGQANYAAVNGFLDGLAAWRHAQGLPALSVAWGPWANDGMAAALSPAHRARIERQGFGFLTPAAAIECMQRVPAAEPVVAIAVLDAPRLRARARPGLAPMLGNLTGAALEFAAPTAPPAWDADNAPSTVAPSALTLSDCLQSEIARVLGFEPTELDLDAPLADLGFDSMMAIQLRNAIGHALKIDVPLGALLQGVSTRELVERVSRDATDSALDLPPHAVSAQRDEPSYEEGML
jgi:acyl transferase domain-containing protein/acyl carrier protein